MTPATSSPARLLLALLILPLAGAVSDRAADAAPLDVRTSYFLRSSVVGAAGSIGTSPGFVSRGTLGQASPIGIGVGQELTLYSGFWGPLFWPSSGIDVLPQERFVNALFQNHPNPCRSSTAITYTVSVEGNVEVQIFDIGGRQVRMLLRHHSPPGAYAVIWDGRDDTGAMALSGVYFYQLKIDDFTAVKRMLMLR